MNPQYPEFLFDSPLFSGFSEKQSRQLLKYFKRSRVKKGMVLFRPNEKSRYLYIVLSGELKIEHQENDKKFRLVANAIAGDIIGEVALLTGEKHTARVKAILDSEVLKISKISIVHLIHKYPILALNLGQIEASRLRNQIVGENLRKPENRFIAHFTSFDPLESHYCGLNLASSMAKASGKNIAYLHLSRCPQTPLQTFSLRISENRLRETGQFLKNFKPSKLNQFLIQHESGLVFLPSLPDDPAIIAFKIRDIPRIISHLGQQYSHVFMELGSEFLQEKKVISILKQADKVLIGVKRNKYYVTELKKTLSMYLKKIPDLSQKVHLYLNDISPIAGDVSHILFQSTNIKREHTTDSPDTQPVKQKNYLSRKSIETVLNMDIDFELRGEIEGLKDYILPDLMASRRKISHAVNSFRSLGRWLANNSRGIALGGGGARALAEIGVLQILEEKNIDFDYVAGTSMGALIGALYACGYKASEMEDMFAKYLPEDNMVFDYGIPLISFFRGRKINALLKNIFGRKRIEELPIRFTCIATDIVSGDEVRISSGPIWRAVRASMSLPVIFPPVRYKNYFLIDGGALNNVPGDVLKQERVQRVLGINCTPIQDTSLSTYLENTQLFRLLRPNRHFFRNLGRLLSLSFVAFRRPPILQIAYRTMMLEGGELIRMKSHHFDYLMNLDVYNYSLFDFHLRKEIIQTGREAAMKELDKILKIFR